MASKQFVALFLLFAISTAQVLLSDGGVDESGTHAAEIQEPSKGAAQPKATGSSQVSFPMEIVAVMGDNATLSVRVNSLLDWTKERMDVKRDDLGNAMVHTYRNQRDYLRLQSAQYKNRTTFIRGPSGGNLSISNLTSNDSGSYTFYFRGLKANCTVFLKVVNTSSTTKLPGIGTGAPNNQASGTKEPRSKSGKTVSIKVNAVLSAAAALVLLAVAAAAAAVCQCGSGNIEISVCQFGGTQRKEAEMHEMKELNKPSRED